MPPLAPSQNPKDLVCLSAHWFTVLRFFALNYLAHAFTIWARPGESTSEKLFASFLALFFPVSGLGRGINAIYRHASYHSHGGFWKGLLGFGSNEYEIHKAARAGALGILVRENIDRGETRERAWTSRFAVNDWNWGTARVRGRVCFGETKNASKDNKRAPDDTYPPLEATDLPPSVFTIQVDGDFQEETPTELRWTRQISGLIAPWRLGEQVTGYRIVELPSASAANITIGEKDKTAKLQIAQSSNLLVSFIAVVQIVYAAYELSRVTGDQLTRFGYAAFHLTVIPYLTMSFVNLLGNMATPLYPAVYLVSSSTLVEAQARGLLFQSTIGHLSLPDEPADQDQQQQPQDYLVHPWSCADHPEPRIAARKEHIPDSTSLNICFNRKCTATHTGTLCVPSGRPKPTESALRESTLKLVALLVAIAAHTGPVIYVGLHYPAPPTLTQRVVSPLWIAASNIFGLYLLYYRFELGVVVQLRMWVLEKLCCGWRLSDKQRKAAKKLSGAPAMWCFFVVCGVVVAGWEAWIVGAQILEVGGCVWVGEGVQGPSEIDGKR